MNRLSKQSGYPGKSSKPDFLSLPGYNFQRLFGLIESQGQEGFLENLTISVRYRPDWKNSYYFL